MQKADSSREPSRNESALTLLLSFKAHMRAPNFFSQPSRYRGPHLRHRECRGILPLRVAPLPHLSPSGGSSRMGEVNCCPFGFSTLLVSVSWRSKPQARETLVSGNGS